VRTETLNKDAEFLVCRVYSNNIEILWPMKPIMPDQLLLSVEELCRAIEYYQKVDYQQLSKNETG